MTNEENFETLAVRTQIETHSIFRAFGAIVFNFKLCF